MFRAASLFFLLLPTFLLAQDFELTSVNLTVQDGLSGNNVYCALQDKDGYIWFGTETGVSRYNGRSFENFRMADGLPDNEIFRIDEDSQGRIWFSAFNAELSYYKEGRFFRQSHPSLPDEKLGSYYVNFFEDSYQTIWLNSKEEVLAIKATGEYHYFTKEQLGGTGVYGFKEENGVLWGLENSGNAMVRLSENNKPNATPEILKIDAWVPMYHDFVYGVKSFLTQNNYEKVKVFLKSQSDFQFDSYKVSKLNSYNSDELWICTYNGVYQLNTRLKTVNHFFKQKILTHVLKDRENGTWFTTLGSGVFYVPSIKNKSMRPMTKETSGRYVSALSEGKSGIWFGGANGIIGLMSEDSVKLSNAATGQFSRTMVKGFAEGRSDHELFVAAEDHLLFLRSIDNIQSISAGVKAIKKIDDDGYALGLTSGMIYWPYQTMREFLEQGRPLGSIVHKIQSVSPKARVFKNTGFTIDIEPYRGGFLYSTSHGVGFVDSNLEIRELDHHPVFNQRVNDILVFNDTSYVFATHGLGVFIYQDEQWLHFTEKNGLASDICKKVIAQNDSTFWVATNAGVSRISLGDEELIKNLNSVDGLLSEEINDLLISDNSLIAATNQGISIIDIQGWESQKAKPSIQLYGLQVSSQPLSKTVKMLNRNDGPVSFAFEGLHFMSLDGLYYEYRLLGQQSEWLRTQNEVVNFGVLPAGDYSFEVRAVSAFGDHSEVASYDFAVRLPFWEQWWFVLLVALVFVLAVLLAAMQLVKRNKLKAQRELDFKLRIADAERKALQSQLNPHFIFNSLNSIQNVVLKKRPQDAYDYLEKFSKLIRRVLEFSDRSLIPIKEDIKTLQLYMQLENLRLQDKFDYHIEVSETIDQDQLITAMILQPLVENAIWHGIVPLKKGRRGKIEVNISGTHEDMFIEVIDNGIGRQDSGSPDGMGTKIVDGLVKNANGHQVGKVDIDDLIKNGEAVGTRVTLNLKNVNFNYDSSFNYR